MEIKSYFGTDVSIDFCKQLTKNCDCDTVVRVYISRNNSRGDDEDRETNIKKAKQMIDENRMALLMAGYSLEEIEEMLEILMKAA